MTMAPQVLDRRVSVTRSQPQRNGVNAVIIGVLYPENKI
jgi:hypothetical protein